MNLTPKATASLKDLLPKLARHDAFRELMCKQEYREAFEEDDRIALGLAINGKGFSDQALGALDYLEEIIHSEAKIVTTLFWVATRSIELDPYPIQICAFAGLYWVDPLEDDLIGYFETQDDAEDWAQDNWNHALYKEDDEAEAL